MSSFLDRLSLPFWAIIFVNDSGELAFTGFKNFVSFRLDTQAVAEDIVADNYLESKDSCPYVIVVSCFALHCHKLG